MMECKHEWATWKSSKRCVKCGKKDEHWGVEHAQGGAARGLEKKTDAVSGVRHA